MEDTVWDFQTALGDTIREKYLRPGWTLVEITDWPPKKKEKKETHDWMKEGF